MYRAFYDHILSRIDAEKAHRLGVLSFRYGAWVFRIARRAKVYPQRPAPVTVMGIDFPGRVGLGAGMDKNAEAVVGLSEAGFAFVEIGTVTAVGQPGNDKPRSWREKDVRGIRNRMGFNNEGADAVAERLREVRSSRRGRDVVLGVNLGKTKTTAPEDAASDYSYSATRLSPYADYLVVNVSSPNTPGLRDLQSTESLRPILAAVREAADAAVPERHVPLLVKIAPDLADEDVDAVADLARELRLDGITATNTTINHQRGPGGLSGPPVHARAKEVVARLRARLGDEAVIVGVGGIDSDADAQAMLDAGATLVQTYTGFVYNGPRWVAQLNAALN
ncbi:quinone-dependent dihydroorotate dehydrogenase [Demequina sp. B12]|uniref:quinone-dependent dihydroorotate dehydrogenase n=1 Tax=Demequina sp. B12 TaxID=2992757 RepID=UPI00237A2973|nr:quinone-dependent dihydroorotate dehydrogenase [Demequina sp. B12]MDE0572944.1 quinone-dependent dihydroorotate dehydrogenase [Demequina sp. B12]